MRRDKNIMKLLLQQLRDGSTPEELKNYDELEIVYNAKLLMDDGYIKGVAIRSHTGQYVSAKLFSINSSGHDLLETLEQASTNTVLSELKAPPEISESLPKFALDYPNPKRTCFIMMRFGNTPAHEEIVAAIREALKAQGIAALRADDKDYHDDLFSNVLTYIYGCGLGVAVYERIEEESFNPNVSLEVGCFIAMRKPVLILKDKTLKNLNTDLVGKLYKSFDPQAPSTTIPKEIDKWLEDRSLSKQNIIP